MLHQIASRVLKLGALGNIAVKASVYNCLWLGKRELLDVGLASRFQPLGIGALVVVQQRICVTGQVLLVQRRRLSHCPKYKFDLLLTTINISK